MNKKTDTPAKATQPASFTTEQQLALCREISACVDVGIIKVFAGADETTAFINARALEIIGYTPEQYRDELGEKLTGFLSKEDAALLQKHANTLVEQGGSVQFQVEALRRDGMPIWLLGTGTARGEARDAAIFTFWQKTQWQTTENELLHKLVNREILLDNIAGGVQLCEYASGFPIHYVNSGFLKMTGYSRREIARQFGNRHAEMVSKEDIARVQGEIRRQLGESTSFSVEYRLCTKTGKELWVVDNGVLIEKEGRMFAQCILTDITAQKRTEEALRISEERYAIAMGYSDVTVFDYDVLTGTSTHQRRDVEEYGLSPVMENTVETMINTGMIPKDSVDVFREIFRRIHGGDMTSSGVVNFISPLGQEYVLEIRLSNIYNAHGKPVRAVGVKKDITETVLLKREKEFGEILVSSKRMTYEANVTRDLVTAYDHQWMKELGLHQMESGNRLTMTRLLEILCDQAVHPDHRAMFLRQSSREAIYTAFENGDRRICFEYRKLVNGQHLWFEKVINIVRDELSEEINIRCYIADVSDRKAQEEKILAGKRHYGALLSKSAVVFEVNLTQNMFITGHEYWGEQFQIRQSNNYSQMMASLYERVVHREDREHFYDIFLRENVLTAYAQGIRELGCEYRHPNEAGEFVWMRCTMYLLEKSSHGDVKGFAYMEEIDEEKKKELELIYKSQRDLLTGFYNKTTLGEKVKAFLSTGEGKTGNHAFFIIDLDYFKTINDSFGHVFGDAVLSQVSGKIKALFRDDDILGRIGGDEFVVLMKNIQCERSALTKAQELCASIVESYNQRGRLFQITVSIGIDFCSKSNRTYEELYQHSDIALYYSKEHGRNRYAVYSKNLNASVSSVREIDREAYVEKKKFEENISEYVFRILYESSNKETAICSVLELVGKHYHVSRAYVFEESRNGEYITNTFEWCNQGVPPQMQELQAVYYRDIGNYQENFGDEGVFYLPDIETVEPGLRAVLEPQHIKSMMQFAIVKDGKFWGFIGFDQCDFARGYASSEVSDYRNISHILGVFITEMRISQETIDTRKMALSVVNGLDSYAYVCDPETYEILFINNITMKIAPKARVGDTCYRAFWNREQPCRECPMAGTPGEKGVNCAMELHNTNLDVWVRATASWIDWLEGRKACLINSVDISEYKKEG